MTRHLCQFRIYADVTEDTPAGTQFRRTWVGRRVVTLPFIPRKGMRITGLIDLPETGPEGLDGEEVTAWFRANFHAVLFTAGEEDGGEQGWAIDDTPVWDVNTSRFLVCFLPFAVSAPVGTTTAALRERFPAWDWQPDVAEESQVSEGG